MTMSDNKRWDIFCAVVDNYGDVGVCWRLARQLVAEFGLNVRLWIDDLHVLQRMYPALQIDCDWQIAAGVCINRWDALNTDDEIADVIIEAFGCQLPAAYIAAMGQRSRAPLWLNLEYLSAETWVEDCHALPSPQPNGLTKYFFFPGFTAKTGGVLKENNLISRRRAFQSDAEARRLYLAQFGIECPRDTLLISLFAYENAPVARLFDALSTLSTPVICLVSEGKVVPAAAHYFGVKEWPVGVLYRRGALKAMTIPFLTQDAYDQLLWCCDLNCVRGEDSFVRAQWAARPFVWQIYPQPEGAHWPKLDAFLALYRQNLPPAAAEILTSIWHGWNGDDAAMSALPEFIGEIQLFRAHAEHWADDLNQQPNLAATLVQFCANQV